MPGTLMGSHLSPVLDILPSRCLRVTVIPSNYAQSYCGVLTEFIDQLITDDISLRLFQIRKFLRLA